jgi:NUMOD4 motif
MGLRLGTTTTKVRWRGIAGFDRYQISEEGQVKNIETGLLIKGTSDQYGNTHLTLYRDAKPYSRRPKRLLKEAFGGYFD